MANCRRANGANICAATYQLYYISSGNMEVYARATHNVYEAVRKPLIWVGDCSEI